MIFKLSDLNKEEKVELHCCEKEEREERRKEEELYLSTGELKPLGGSELPCSVLLDTAMLFEKKQGMWRR